MYILDTGNNRVLRWVIGDPVGFAVAGGRGAGTAINRLGTSYAMYVDASQNIYVSEYSNHRVSKWIFGDNSTGILVGGNGTSGSADSMLSYPWGIYVNANDTMYIVDYGNHRVQRWFAGKRDIDNVDFSQNISPKQV